MPAQKSGSRTRAASESFTGHGTVNANGELPLMMVPSKKAAAELGRAARGSDGFTERHPGEAGDAGRAGTAGGSTASAALPMFAEEQRSFCETLFGRLRTESGRAEHAHAWRRY